jgi:hypothetical protein
MGMAIDQHTDEFLADWKNPAMFSYAIDANFFLRQIDDYVLKRGEHPMLGLVLHGFTLTETEIKAVLCAVDRLGAASTLLSNVVNRLD